MRRPNHDCTVRQHGKEAAGITNTLVETGVFVRNSKPHNHYGRDNWQFTAAAREDPNHLQANAKMRSLNAAKAPRPEAEGGLFGRIFRRRDS